MNVQSRISGRDDDSLVKSMSALERFEAERQARTQRASNEEFEREQERWVAEVRRLASEEALAMEAERRRFEAEIVAAATRSAARRELPWLRLGALALVLLMAGAAAAAHRLEQRETAAQALALGDAAATQRRLAAANETLRADVARLDAQAAALAARNTELRAALEAQAPEALGFPYLDAPPAGLQVTPLAPVATPPAAAPAPEPRAPSAKRRTRASRHADKAAPAPAPAPAGKPAPPVKLCPPDQPICD